MNCYQMSMPTMLILLVGLLSSPVAALDHCGPAETPEEQASQQSGTPMLGIRMTPPPARIQQEQGLSPSEGVYVFHVYDDSAAQELGVQRGDVITSINGRSINSMSDLREAVMANQVGDPVQVTVRRDRQDQTLDNGAFREWPSSIPMRDIDSRAEDRYRERQTRRLVNQLDREERIDQQARELAEQAADLERRLAEDSGLDADTLATALRDHDGDPARALAQLGGERGLLPATLLRELPDWRFSWALETGPAPQRPQQSQAVRPSSAALLPPIAMQYRCHISSEIL